MLEDYSACCGIESLINPVDMGVSLVNPLTPSANSYVDWCYFSDPNSDCNQNPGYGDPTPKEVNCLTPGPFLHETPQPSFEGDYPGFKLDPIHAGTYNVTEYLYNRDKLPAIDYDSDSGRDYYPACPQP